MIEFERHSKMKRDKMPIDNYLKKGVNLILLIFGKDNV